MLFGLTIDGDDTKAYHLTNAIDNNNIQFAIGDDTKKMPVPLCYIYKPEDYLNICNIKFEKFLPSFQDYISNEYIYGVANEVMLRMLSAHDWQRELEKKSYMTLHSNYPNGLKLLQSKSGIIASR